MIHWQDNRDARGLRTEDSRVFALPGINFHRVRPAFPAVKRPFETFIARELRLVARDAIRQEGQTMADYAVVLGVVIVTCVAAIGLLADSIGAKLTSSSALISRLVP